MADAIGLSPAAYRDLESYDDEAFMSISLGQLRSLAQALAVTIRELVSDAARAQPARGTTSPEDLVQRIEAELQATGETVTEFSSRVGWDVAPALEDPRTIAPQWNADGLIAICDAVEVPWLDVLSAIETQSGD